MKINLKQKKLAKNVFKAFCELLDEKGVKYTKNKERLVVNCILQGDDLPIAVNGVEYGGNQIFKCLLIDYAICKTQENPEIYIAGVKVKVKVTVEKVGVYLAHCDGDDISSFRWDGEGEWR